MDTLKKHKLVYLATPYSKFPGGIEEGFKAACRVTARMLEAGVKVYSPIAHTHPIAIHGGVDPYDHDIWLPFDEAMMEAADAICIAMLPTWGQSKGVLYEREYFSSRRKPVYHLNTETMRLV